MNHSFAVRNSSSGSIPSKSIGLALSAVWLLSALALGQEPGFKPNPNAGPGSIIVKSKFGGQIFGFDIDQNGTEGILSEALGTSGVTAAVETFSQTNGRILKTLVQTNTQDDYLTMGVVGASVGLIEHEHVTGFLHVQRTFNVVNPLTANRFTGSWKPPIDSKHIIEPGGVSRTQGSSQVAVFVTDNSGNFEPLVFSSDVAKNTFGPVVTITDSNDFGSVPPPIAFDTATSQAILGGGPGCFACLPVIGLVDTVKGTFTTFTGIGFGFINGKAVDSADGIFVTTTEDDANIEFYNLSTQTGFTVVLPGSSQQQFFSGADVEYDAVNKVFLVAQPNSSTASSGSAIYVYDTQGNLQETLNGFSFSNTFNVVAMHIALKPSNRSGFVDGPDAGVTEIQSFTY
jgi:hypothetical protein